MGSDASITIDITHWWTFHSFNLIINYCYAYGYFLHYIIHCHYWSTEKYHSHYSPIISGPNFIGFHSIAHYLENEAYITQFLAAICPHFHYPFTTAESKQPWIFNKNTAIRVPIFALGQSRETLCFDIENLCFDRQLCKLRMYESWITKFEMLNSIITSSVLQPQANDCDLYVLIVYIKNEYNACNCMYVKWIVDIM